MLTKLVERFDSYRLAKMRSRADENDHEDE